MSELFPHIVELPVHLGVPEVREWFYEMKLHRYCEYVIHSSPGPETVLAFRSKAQAMMVKLRWGGDQGLPGRF